MNKLPCKLRTLIVDDELKSRLYLNKLIHKYCSQLEIVGMAANREETLHLISEKKPQLIFLDILMPNTNGFEILEMLEERNFFVVFVSAHEKFGIKAIQANAIDYILKPVNTVDLQRAVSRVMDKWTLQNVKQEDLKNTGNNKNSNQKITLSYSEGFHILNPSEINRLESDNSYTTVYKSTGEAIVCTKSIQEFEKILDENSFIRIHRSHIVNLNFVQGFNRKYNQVVILSNGDKVPVARRKLKLFHDRLSYFLNRE